jgi:hypothetical protein
VNRDSVHPGPKLQFLFHLRVADPDPHGSVFILVGWIRIQEEKMNPKSEENSSFEVVRDEDFFCSLDVLYGGLEISKLQFLI